MGGVGQAGETEIVDVCESKEGADGVPHRSLRLGCGALVLCYLLPISSRCSREIFTAPVSSLCTEA